MAKLWVTYAWVDNDDGDVDYVAQELRSAGLEIRIDRQKIQAGLRLWEQIGRFISDQGECDAWMIYATQASLTSEACREELAYAVDRALNARGGEFPLIALFPATVSRDLIPAAIRVRLYVSLTDPDWAERIVEMRSCQALWCFKAHSAAGYMRRRRPAILRARFFLSAMVSGTRLISRW